MIAAEAIRSQATPSTSTRANSNGKRRTEIVKQGADDEVELRRGAGHQASGPVGRRRDRSHTGVLIHGCSLLPQMPDVHE